ncbi:hypothetical protein [Streptomyces werraensis]
MSSLLRVQGQIGQRTLLLTTAAEPLTGTMPSINGRRVGRPGTAV